MRMTETEFTFQPVALLAPPRHPNYDTPEGVLFRKALALIEDEPDWCGEGLGDGKTRCSIHSVVYASYQLSGHFDGLRKERWVIYSAIEKAAGTNQSVPAFNDTHTHAEVIAAWVKAGRANGWIV